MVMVLWSNVVSLTVRLCFGNVVDIRVGKVGRILETDAGG